MFQEGDANLCTTKCLHDARGDPLPRPHHFDLDAVPQSMAYSVQAAYRRLMGPVACCNVIYSVLPVMIFFLPAAAEVVRSFTLAESYYPQSDQEPVTARMA